MNTKILIDHATSFIYAEFVKLLIKTYWVCNSSLSSRPVSNKLMFMQNFKKVKTVVYLYAYACLKSPRT